MKRAVTAMSLGDCVVCVNTKGFDACVYPRGLAVRPLRAGCLPRDPSPSTFASDPPAWGKAGSFSSFSSMSLLILQGLARPGTSWFVFSACVRTRTQVLRKQVGSIPSQAAAGSHTEQ